jgi:hypothetical protein
MSIFKKNELVEGNPLSAEFAPAGQFQQNYLERTAAAYSTQFIAGLLHNLYDIQFTAIEMHDRPNNKLLISFEPYTDKEPSAKEALAVRSFISDVIKHKPDISETYVARVTSTRFYNTSLIINLPELPNIIRGIIDEKSDSLSAIKKEIGRKSCDTLEASWHRNENGHIPRFNN